MPYIHDLTYKPPYWLKNGHIATIYPYFKRNLPEIKFNRELLITSDEDHFAVDFIRNKNRKIAYLLHGLEGSSESQYILGLSHLLSNNGWAIAVINYRGCGGIDNKKIYSYHSGATEDVHQFVQHSIDNYDAAVMIGFSLGANMMLKYLGENKYPISSKIKTAFAISSPADLSAGSDELNRWDNKGYSLRFLKSLKPKVVKKMELYQGVLDESKFKEIKTIRDFDDFYTGPVHGFKNAEDYYQKCSCNQFIDQITIPTYMINALDDPFIPSRSYPFDIAKDSKLFTLITSNYGGHVGFYIPKKSYCWQEYKILDILKSKEIS